MRMLLCLAMLACLPALAANAILVSGPRHVWRATTDQPKWEGREGHAVIEFNGRLWVLGGYRWDWAKGRDILYNDVWSSADGTEWTLESAAAPWQSRRDHGAVVFDNRLWILGGRRVGSALLWLRDVWSSADGVNWVPETQAAAWTPRGLHGVEVHAGLMWVIGGHNLNDVWSSPDGVNWTEETAFAPWAARAGNTTAAFDSRLWVLGGADTAWNVLSDVWSSVDGVNWTLETAAAQWPPRSGHVTVALGNRLWVYGGGTFDDVWSSPDGIAWTPEPAAPWFRRDASVGAVYDGRLWLLGGSHQPSHFRLCFNDVWASADGANWSSHVGGADWAARHGHTSARFKQRFWVMGGRDAAPMADVWSSADGAAWTQTTPAAGWSARSGHTSAVFNDRLWVFGGDDGAARSDVWSSTDGASWAERAATADWPARHGHATVVFKSRLWMFGGRDAGLFNDVWHSADGVNWTQATAAAAWSPRDGHATAVYDGRIWLMGGEDATGLRNDVWTSGDGVNWQQETATVNWAPRRDHAAFLKDELGGYVVIAGGRTPNGPAGDIWLINRLSANWSQESHPMPHFSPRAGHTLLYINKRIWVLGGEDGEARSDVWVREPGWSAPGVTFGSVPGCALQRHPGATAGLLTFVLALLAACFAGRRGALTISR